MIFKKINGSFEWGNVFMTQGAWLWHQTSLLCGFVTWNPVHPQRKTTASETTVISQPDAQDTGSIRVGPSPGADTVYPKYHAAGADRLAFSAILTNTMPFGGSVKVTNVLLAAVSKESISWEENICHFKQMLDGFFAWCIWNFVYFSSIGLTEVAYFIQECYIPAEFQFSYGAYSK